MQRNITFTVNGSQLNMDIEVVDNFKISYCFFVQPNCYILSVLIFLCFKELIKFIVYIS